MFFAFVLIASGSRIFFITPFTAKSHWLYLQSFVRALLERALQAIDWKIETKRITEKF